VALFIPVFGKRRRVNPKNGRTFTVDEVSELVGNLIESAPVRGKIVLCDEEGKLNSKPYNFVANIEYSIAPDFWVGDVLVCEPSELD
jgi:hypothetical protein